MIVVKDNSIPLKHIEIENTQAVNNWCSQKYIEFILLRNEQGFKNMAGNYGQNKSDELFAAAQ